MCVTRFEISDTHNQSINIDIEDMKLKHILGLCLGAFLAASCSENEVIGSMDVVKLSSTFAAIPSEGGETEITVRLKASGSWTASSPRLARTRQEARIPHGSRSLTGLP